MLDIVVLRWLLRFLRYTHSNYENTLCAYLHSLHVFARSDTLYIPNMKLYLFSNPLTYTYHGLYIDHSSNVITTSDYMLHPQILRLCSCMYTHVCTLL